MASLVDRFEMTLFEALTEKTWHALTDVPPLDLLDEVMANDLGYVDETDFNKGGYSCLMPLSAFDENTSLWDDLQCISCFEQSVEQLHDSTAHSCSRLPGIQQFLYPVYPVLSDDDSGAPDTHAGTPTTTTATVDIASDESGYGSTCSSPIYEGLSSELLLHDIAPTRSCDDVIASPSNRHRNAATPAAAPAGALEMTSSRAGFGRSRSTRVRKPSRLLIQASSSSSSSSSFFVSSSSDARRPMTSVFTRPRREKKSKTPHLWKFMRALLDDAAYNPEYIRWENKAEGVFRIVPGQSKNVARLWGDKKHNKTMTFDKLSRSLRWCKTSGFLCEVPKNGKYPKKLCFRFSDAALRWTPDTTALSL